MVLHDESTRRVQGQTLETRSAIIHVRTVLSICLVFAEYQVRNEPSYCHCHRCARCHSLHLHHPQYLLLPRWVTVFTLPDGHIHICICPEALRLLVAYILDLLATAYLSSLFLAALVQPKLFSRGKANL
jgi:hypothetical protein